MTPAREASGRQSAGDPLSEFAALLLTDWLESWRGIFPKHDRTRQWAFIIAVSLFAVSLMGGLSFYGFAGLARVLGPKTPAYSTWLVPFLTMISYGWFFLTTIWLGRTYRRRERIIPLLLSPLPFPAIAAYVMLRDTGMLLLLLTLLGYPFILGGLLGLGADVSAIALSLPVWLLAGLAGLAMANALILLLFRVLPAGWEGPMSFATANVLILMLPFLTRGLTTPWVPFYWPGLIAAEVFQVPAGPGRLAAIGSLALLAAGWLLIVYTLTQKYLHLNWSKSEELVPSRLLGKISFLSPGASPWRAIVLKDWLLTTRAWGEVMVVVILLGVAMRLRANMGVPVVAMEGAPLLGALLMAWGMIELLAFLGESHQEGPNTLVLTLSPISARQLVWAKWFAIAMPRLALGELALTFASVRGDLELPHVLIGQVGLLMMVTTLSWLEVPHAFTGDPDRLGPFFRLWEKLYGFWRLLAIYPGIGLFCVIVTQVAAIAWDQGVSGLTGVALGALVLLAVLVVCFSELHMKRKLGEGASRPAPVSPRASAPPSEPARPAVLAEAVGGAER